MLSAINMKKTNYIVREDYDQPDSYTFLYELSQENILAKQIENITKQIERCRRPCEEQQYHCHDHWPWQCWHVPT